MKIAEFTANLSSGGAETLTKNLSLEFKKRGHDVKVIIWDKVNPTEYEQKTIHMLHAAGIETFEVGRIQNRFKKWFSNLFCFCKLVRYLRKEKFDLLHTHTTVSDIYARLAKILLPKNTKLFFTIHNSKMAEGFVSTLRRWSHKSGKVIFCSNAAYEKNKDFYYDNAIYIENGVPFLKDINTDIECHSKSEKRDTVVLISVGRMDPQKNRECLILALANLKKMWEKNFILKICGGGDFSNIVNLTEQFELSRHVEVLGVRTDVNDLLLKADIFVSTSLWEGMPLAVLEAFQSGIPCVVSPIQEHIDIAEGVTGCIIAEHNEPEAIAKAIIEAYTRREPHEDLRAKRKSILERFSIENCATCYLEVFGEYR